MSRLTERSEVDSLVSCNIDDECTGECGRCLFNQKIRVKLKQYEDKEEQGLLIELRCKVGDVVYHEKPYVTLHTGIQAYQITNIMISQNKKGEWTKKYRAMLLLNGKIVDSQINFSFDEIGKTVFFTEAEAEEALAKMNKED